MTLGEMSSTMTFSGKYKVKRQILRRLQMNWDAIGYTAHKGSTANAYVMISKAIESIFIPKFATPKFTQKYACMKSTHI